MLNMSCDYVRRRALRYHDERTAPSRFGSYRESPGELPGVRGFEANDLRVMSDVLRTSGRDEERAAWMSRLWPPNRTFFSAFTPKTTHRPAIASVSCSTTRAARRRGGGTRRVVRMYGDWRASVGARTSRPSRSCEGHHEPMVPCRHLLAEDSVELPRADAEAVMLAAVMNQDTGDDGSCRLFPHSSRRTAIWRTVELLANMAAADASRLRHMHSCQRC